MHHPTPSGRARARSVSIVGTVVKSNDTARGKYPAYLYFLRRTQVSKHGGHALALCIPNGPKSIARIRTDDEAGHVGGDKP
jgi:hypothetical protein